MRPYSSSFGSDAGAFHLSFPFVLVVGDPPGCPEPAATTTKTCFRDQSYSYYTAMRQLKLVGNVTKGEIRGKAKRAARVYFTGGAVVLCAMKRKVFGLSVYAVLGEVQRALNEICTQISVVTFVQLDNSFLNWNALTQSDKFRGNML